VPLFSTCQRLHPYQCHMQRWCMPVVDCGMCRSIIGLGPGVTLSRSTAAHYLESEQYLGRLLT
jgi:hypothetical protein